MFYSDAIKIRKMFNVEEVKKLTQDYGYGFHHMPVIVGEPELGMARTELVLIGEPNDYYSYNNLNAFLEFQENLINRVKPKIILHHDINSSDARIHRHISSIESKLGLTLKSASMPEDLKAKYNDFGHNTLEDNYLGGKELDSLLTINSTFNEIWLGGLLRNTIRKNRELQKSSEVKSPVVAIVDSNLVLPESYVYRVLIQERLLSYERDENEISFVAINQNPKYLLKIRAIEDFFEYKINA